MKITLTNPIARTEHGNPVDADSNICVSTTDPVNHVSMAMPFTASGRLCVTLSEGNIVYLGGVPYIDNRLALSEGQEDHINSGKPYTVDGRLCCEVV